MNQEQQVQAELNKNLKAAESEESLSFEIEKQSLVVYYQNIDQIELNFYEIDLEVLFSRTPFLNKDRHEFSFVRANYTEKIILKKQNSLETLRFDIPKILASKNLYIQLKSATKVLNLNYFFTNLKV